MADARPRTCGTVDGPHTIVGGAASTRRRTHGSDRSDHLQGQRPDAAGHPVKAGDKAPDSRRSTRLAAVSLKDFAGKTKIISVTPSLDTPCATCSCASSTRRPRRSPRRGCHQHQHGPAVRHRPLLLDGGHRERQDAVGSPRRVVRAGLRRADQGTPFLTRSIFVVDKNDVVTYAEIVPE